MKIIWQDNFNREMQSESVVASGIPRENWARIMCDALREQASGDTSPNWFEVKPDDYELYVFNPQ